MRGKKKSSRLKHGASGQFAIQPFMSTTNKRAMELKAKVSFKFEGAFEKKQKKREKN